MNRFWTLLLAASCLTAVGQVTYPYNPDGNADGDIAVGDLQDFLTVYGNPFSPSEIMVGDSSLTYWVEQLSQTIDSLQNNLLETQATLSGLSPTYFLPTEGYPQGQLGEHVTLDFNSEPSYTVPSGKNLYVLYQHGGPDFDFRITSDTGESVEIVYNYVVSSNQILFGEGFTIEAANCSYSVGCYESWQCILVDRTFFEAVLIKFDSSNLTYTVPQDKSLVTLSVNDYELAVSAGQWVYEGYTGPDAPSHPLGQGLSLSYQPNESNPDVPTYLFGYLVDEDYFDTPLQESEEPVLSNCFLEYGYEQVYDIPVGCDHVIVQPPTEVPIWEVSGFTPAGYTTLYNVPLNSVVDTIISSQMSDVLEIMPSYNNFMEINLSTAGLSEIIIECGGTFDFEEFVLPTLLSFQIAIGDDNWICDNGVVRLPTIRPIDNDTGFESRIKFISQNRDFSTVEGLTGDQSDWLSGSDQMAKYRKSYIGRWSELWSGVD